MLDDLKIFIAAAESQSLTTAAEKLGMTIATVSRRIAALEKTLGVVLLHRSTKGLTLTTAGESYYQECAEFISALDQRLSNLHHTLNSLEGEVKILAPTNMGSGPLDEFWQAFSKKYPQISLRIVLNNDLQDLLDSQADLALRVGKQLDSPFIHRKVGDVHPVLVASPLLQPQPNSIEEISHLPSLAGTHLSKWEFVHTVTGQEASLDKQHRHCCNDMRVILSLAAGGEGVAFLPEGLAHPSIQTGELVRLLPEWHGKAREIYLVWPYRRSLSVRAKLLRDELMNYLQQQSWITSV